MYIYSKIQVHNAFRDFDRNGDGYVDPDEAKAVLLPKGFSDQQVSVLHRRIAGLYTACLQ